MKNRSFTLIMLVIALSIFSVESVWAQDKKLEKAEKNFCASIQNLAGSLQTLATVNESSSMDEFRRAYKSADKAWNKFQKSAEKLEKVEIKESQKAYNKLVDTVNKIDGDTKTSDAAMQIDQYIDLTAGEIADILTVFCEY